VEALIAPQKCPRFKNSAIFGSIHTLVLTFKEPKHIEIQQVKTLSFFFFFFFLFFFFFVLVLGVGGPPPWPWGGWPTLRGWFGHPYILSSSSSSSSLNFLFLDLILKN
jgi:hypothetical protein